MALAAQSALLDELMGKHRNDVDKNKKDPHWSDEEICKYYIVGLCPHTLFTNTRADLGPCDKVHDDSLAEKYKKSPKCSTHGYEEELQLLLNELIDDVERRIRKGNDRLRMNGPTLNGGFHEERIRKLDEVTKKIEELVDKAEKLGNKGKVSESKEILTEVDDLRSDQGYFQKEIDMYNQSAKALEVCSICGAFRIKDDAPSRTEEHLLGKMHIGYSEVRNFHEKLKEIITNKRRGRSENKSDKHSRRSRSRHGSSKIKNSKERSVNKKDHKQDRDKCDKSKDKKEKSDKKENSIKDEKSVVKKEKSEKNDKSEKKISKSEEKKDKSDKNEKSEYKKDKPEKKRDKSNHKRERSSKKNDDDRDRKKERDDSRKRKDRKDKKRSRSRSRSRDRKRSDHKSKKSHR